VDAVGCNRADSNADGPHPGGDVGTTGSERLS
jgi:hypothetical protein